jgi:tetratricopeptide (TPR) repeat protein
MKKHLLLVITAILLLMSAGVFAQSTIIIDFDASSEDALSAAIEKVAEEAYELNMKGLDALEKKDLDAALNLFNQAITAFPQYSDALNNRGVVLYRRGDVGGARRSWEEAVKRDPQYHVAYYNLGLLHVHSKQLDLAIKQFELALKHNKKFTEAMLKIGAVHMQQGGDAAALVWFGKAYKNDPKNTDAINFYSYSLIVAGDTATAVTVLQSAGNNPDALAQLGRIEAGKKRYAQAIDYLTKAISRGAPASVILELASVQIDAGKCKDAMATVNNHMAKEGNPSIDAWLIAGFAAKECGDDKKALEYYESGLVRYPRDPLLMYNAGQVYFSLKNYTKAETMWAQTGDAYQNPQILYMRAIAARFRNDLASAEQHIKKAISMDEKAEYHDFLGILLNTKGNSKAAEEHFRKALKIDPNLASAKLNLAVKSKDAGDLDKAIADAEKTFASCKGNNCAEAALQLSILHYHRKNVGKALSTLESVKEADRNASTYRHIAIYSKELQNFDKAATALETAAKKYGSDMKLQYELAEAYLSAGSPSKAIGIFTALAPKWKDNVWRLYYQLGYAYNELNDLASAKASFEKSLAAKKDNPAARALLAFVLNRMGEMEKAVGHWEATVKEDGSNATIHINLGLSYETKGQFDRALESYRKAQSLDPADKAININLGNAYKGLGRIPEAFDSYTKGLESKKRDLAAYSIFILARERKDNDRAGKMHDLLKKEFPSSTHYQRVSAEMNLVKGDTAKATVAFEGIKDKDVDDWYALARIYASQGQRAKAEAALAKIPDDSKWSAEKRLIRARLLFNAGDFKAAFLAYRELVNAAPPSSKDIDTHAYNMVLAAHNAKMYREAISAAADAVKKAQGSARAEICRIAGNSAVAIKSWPDAKNWFTQLAGI